MSPITEGQVLVIGGGVTGMRASLDLANLGIEVHLIERGVGLGGILSRVDRIFPSMARPDDLLGEMISSIQAEKMITVHLESVVLSLAKDRDAFDATISTSDGTRSSLRAGCVIAATGLSPFDPSVIPEFGYGRLANVMTSLDFESVLRRTEGGPLKTNEGLPVKSLAFVQCVGSRVERRGLPYCSAVCCMGAIKNAILLKKLYPEIEISILYIDIRTHGKGWEDAYREARKLGIRFIRGQPSMITRAPGGQRLRVNGENTLMKELYQLEEDMVVLQVGLENPPENKELLLSLGIGIRYDGLPSSDLPPRIFVAGAVESPKDLSGCLAQAGACAAQAASLIMGEHFD